ncbi:MAG: hypothetical protein NZ870_05255, partial [bacterium]|nr:hypothetical protein [bacterium]
MAVYSIVKLSELECVKRIDAEYYKPEYLQIRELLQGLSTKQIKEISESVISFGAYSLCNYISYTSKGIPYLNVENIKEGYIDWENIKYIDERTNNLLKKSQVREGQVILTMAGTIGNAAVAYNIPSKLNSNQAIAKITLYKNFSPFYVSAFLNSYYGKIQTHWEIVSNVQPNIFLWQIKKVKVFIPFDKSLENKITNLYKKGLDLLLDSRTFYTQAEDLLLQELGLKDYKPQYKKTYSAKLSDALSARRIDAEYFQPAYEEVIERIRNRGIEIKPLKSFLCEIQKGVEVGSENYLENGKLFLRVSNLSVNGFTDKDQKYISDEIYQRFIKYKLNVGDFLLTKDATPGIAYVIKEDVEGIISSGIVKLKIDEDQINKEYLALCINSIIGKSQVERDVGGSV